MSTNKKTSTRKSVDPAQRKAEMEALHSRLTEQVEALRSSDEWRRYLNFLGAFHRYSFNNVLLILGQSPEATRIAGYRRWQSLGRQVRKGEKSIRIFGGRDLVTSEEDEQTGEETSRRRRTVFFPVSVFNINQTEVIEGHEDISHPTQQLAGEDEAGIYEQVTAWLSAHGWTVNRETLPGATCGYTTPDGRRVVIDDTLSPAQAAKTALHEAAHITLGHLDDDFAAYVAHRGRYEVEAESVAYVTAGLLGLDTSAYSVGYVAGWAEDDAVETIKESAAGVLAAVHTLADALAGETDDTSEAQAA